MVEVKSIVLRAHAPDLDASVAFYEKLRFTVRDDDVNGHGTRVVQMIHRDMASVVLVLREAPAQALTTPIDSSSIPEDLPVLFTLVPDDYLDWTKHLETAGVPLFSRASHPWGVWLIVKDPAGNLVAISTFDRY